MAHARQVLLRGIDSRPGSAAEDPVTFLRTYSNYLAPRPGLFSADTWTIAFIWVRNVLLNQLIIAPAIAALAIVALLVVFAYQLPFQTYVSFFDGDIAALAVAGLCLVVAVERMARSLRPIALQSTTSTRLPDEQPQIDASGAVLAAVFVAIVALGGGHVENGSRPWVMWTAFPLLMAFMQWAGGFLECYRARRRAQDGVRGVLSGRAAAIFNLVWISTAAGSAGALLLPLVWRLLNGQPAWFHVAFGPPLVAVALILSVMLLVGLMGADYPDAAREWTARVGARLGIATAAWLALFTLMVFGPWSVAAIAGNFEKSGLAAAIAWIVTTAGGVLAGRSPRTANGTQPDAGSRVLGTVAAIAPTVFLVGYVIAIAAGVQALIPYDHVSAADGPQAPPRTAVVTVKTPTESAVELKITPEAPGTLDRLMAPVRGFARRYPSLLALRRAGTPSSLEPEAQAKLKRALVLLAGVLLVAVLAARRININEFSLHHFYKNRLVRCYLGASQGVARRPDPLTGFDPLDDFPISKLDPEHDDPEYGRYYGPYPIVNTALNLNAGSELATQERKASSFVLTPRYCGFDAPAAPASDVVDGLDPNGYRDTRGYASLPGPDLGTSMAISGAAANPNWGYHTSGPMAFLLTVFNARLGWWLGNPRFREASRHAGPKFALRYLFWELLGQTTGTSEFVNLSDGGHFDNLGFYELVRRRARFIIVCDAEEDHDLTFGSLGAAIRKCRADFGVEIDINPQPIQVKAGKVSTAHCVVGTILYPERENTFNAGLTSTIELADGTLRCRGWLLYIKSSLTGDEPADVAEYRAQHGEFPHQSTADQFFSESQFESYRRLGYHVLRSAFDGVDTPRPPAANDSAVTPLTSADKLAARYPLVKMFQDLTRKWYAPIPVTTEAATRLALEYVDLMWVLVKTEGLEQIAEEIVGGTPSKGKRQDKPTPAEVAAGMAVMQLVQNVYTEFGLESAFNRANPRNSGWTNVFRKWRQSRILHGEIWPGIEKDYHPLFRRYFDKDLAQRFDDVPEHH